MSLNITKLDPASLAILNKWATEMENNHNALKKQVQRLQGALHSTTGSNPALANNK